MCDSLKEPKCDSSKGCKWCSGKWFSKCFSDKEADKLLPSAGFVCADPAPAKNKTDLCDNYLKPKECNDDPKCSWCINEWFAKCYNYTVAEGLPPAFFKCHNDTLPNTCSDIKGPQHCSLNKTCSWCTGKDVKDECFSYKVAETLPTDFYNCSGVKPPPPPPPPTPPPPPPVDCMKLGEKACGKEPAQCEWCSGDLIIPKCFNISVADKLPKEFFKCKKAPKHSADEEADKAEVEALLLEIEKDAHQQTTVLTQDGAESECVKQLEPACKKTAKCAWCSMEFYSMCFSKAIASDLPAFIFNCSGLEDSDQDSH